MADDRGNIRGSPEPDRAEGIVVGFHHARDTHTVRVLGVAIECKLMGDLEEERRRKMGKTLTREHNIKLVGSTFPPMFAPNPRAGKSLSLQQERTLTCINPHPMSATSPMSVTQPVSEYLSQARQTNGLVHYTLHKCTGSQCTHES